MKDKITKLLGAAVITSCLLVNTALAEEALVESFSDVSAEDEYFAAIDHLRENGVIEGYEDGSYGIARSINRAEFLKIAMLGNQTPVGASDLNCYPDVTEDQWYADIVCSATEMGIVEGYEDGLFKPTNTIGFAEASKIIAKVYNLDVDDSLAENWFQKYVEALADEAAVPLSISDFTDEVERGEMAEIIWRVQEDANFHPTKNYTLISQKSNDYDRSAKKFETCAAVNSYFEELMVSQVYYPMEEAEMSVEADAGSNDSMAAPTASVQREGGADDYSTTNIQVEGVDEADFVKNDGEFIYIVKGDSVRVVRAYPSTSMEEVAFIKVPEMEGVSPRDIYVDGDRLVLLASEYSNILPYRSTYYSGGLNTKVFIFDIADLGNISLERNLSFEGNIISSRRIGDKVYLVSSRPVPYYYDEENPTIEYLPYYTDSKDGFAKPIVGCEDIYFEPGNLAPSASFLNVIEIPTRDNDAEIKTAGAVGTFGVVYSSLNNLYVASTEYNYGIWEADSMIAPQSYETTFLHKFALDDLNYAGMGRVDGRPLNQFSLDEKDGEIRIATQKGSTWDSSNPATSNVYVLDAGMNVIGELEGIAPGENMHSTRFAGDRLYMVTFLNIDPFFVIDLSDSRNPSILGELKIPGFSDYLHVYDENHVIGFGKDTVISDENSNFAWYQGLKLAMFDVSDVDNPSQLHVEIIGDRGTNSTLLYDHRALLFDKDKNLMAFPVTLAELSDEIKSDPYADGSEFGDYTFQGAYVYDVSVENGFQLKDRLSHYDMEEVKDNSGYYWYGDSDIQRILYIGDKLYTVSFDLVKAFNLSNLNFVNEASVGGTTDFYGGDIIMF